MECDSVSMADRVMQSGLKCLYTTIPTSQIEREKFINLLMCFNCYQYEHHKTEDCPNKDVTSCSECAAIGHSYRECKSQTKQCLNCSGPHRTKAMACPVKKQNMKQKEKEQESAANKKQTETYSQIAKQAAEIATKPAQVLSVEGNVHLDIVAIVIHAHLHNIATGGGTYKTEACYIRVFKAV